MYGDFKKGTDFVRRAVLAPRHCAVDQAKRIAIELFPGSPTRLYSVDTVAAEDSDCMSHLCPTEVLNDINPLNFPPHQLTLKPGMPVIMLRNLSLAAGLSNGTRLQVVEMKPRVIKAEILTGPKAREIVFIPRIRLDSKSESSAVEFKRRQFPLRTAFAMTINKAQGQTFQCVGLDLTEDCFSHGQLYVHVYVALSRVGHPTFMRVFAPDASQVANVVWQDVVREPPPSPRVRLIEFYDAIAVRYFLAAIAIFVLCFS